MAKKLKIGLIGTGGIARACHIPGYQALTDDCEIVWACDVDAELAQKTANEHGIPKVTADYRDVLNDKEVDAVSITTPNKHHKNHRFVEGSLREGAARPQDAGVHTDRARRLRREGLRPGDRHRERARAHRG